MSAAIDVNVLLFASDSASPLHQRAGEFLEECAAGPDVLYLAWSTVMSYLRISTHPAIVANPLQPEEAVRNAETLLRLPHVRTPGNSECRSELQTRRTHEARQFTNQSSPSAAGS